MSLHQSDFSEPDQDQKAWEACPDHGPWLRSEMTSGTWYCKSPTCPTCLQERKIRALLGKAMIPARFAKCTFNSYLTENTKQKAILKACQRYAEGFAQAKRDGTCLIMHGRPGTGKNHLATAICVSVMDQGHITLVITLADLLARIRDTWQSNSETTESHILRRFINLNLLVIDEVGKTSGSQNEKDLLFRIIDGRYLEIRPTIILSNSTLQAIEKHIGPASYDRLREGGGKALHFDWTSNRTQK